MMSDVDLPAAHIRTQVCSAVDVIVHLARLRGGRRVVWEIAAVEGTHRGEPVVTPLFRFRPRDGAEGGFEATGAIPEVVGDAREPRRVAGPGSVRRGRGSMIAVPAMLVAAGIAAGAAVGCLRRSVVVRRIAPERSASASLPRRPTIPGPDWPWWPIAGALVGWGRRGRRRGRRRRGRRAGGHGHRCAGDVTPGSRRPSTSSWPTPSGRSPPVCVRGFRCRRRSRSPPRKASRRSRRHSARIVDGVSSAGASTTRSHGVGERGRDRRRSAGGRRA